MSNSIGCFVLGTTLPNRVDKLLETLGSIDKNNIGFANKTLTLDDFGQWIPNVINDYCATHKWTILIHPKAGMFSNMGHGLNTMQSTWTLYCEDDVIIEKLPTKEQIEQISEQLNIGYISLTGGGYQDKVFEKEIKKEIYCTDSFIKVGENEVFWKRNKEYASAWWFEFPAMICRTSIFKDCYNHIAQNIHSMQIEQAFTRAFYELGYFNSYERVTWMRNIYENLFPKLDIFASLSVNLSQICDELVYIKHNRPEIGPSVGDGYNV